MQNEMVRYARIVKKNPREIVLLRGRGCEWKKCRFCDYHEDYSSNVDSNFNLNTKALALVTGEYHSLEVINSGSFPNIDEETMALIHKVCKEKQIQTLRFECHWLSRKMIAPLKDLFQKENITVKIKMGVESFDIPYREHYLNKGMGPCTPQDIACFADEICLLQGIPNQTEESMKRDIETGLAYFERVCVNIMTPNSAPIQPDEQVKNLFLEKIYPLYKDNPRVDILLENTDFGVGAEEKPAAD